jgi:hypothetical protein
MRRRPVNDADMSARVREALERTKIMALSTSGPAGNWTSPCSIALTTSSNCSSCRCGTPSTPRTYQRTCGCRSPSRPTWSFLRHPPHDLPQGYCPCLTCTSQRVVTITQCHHRQESSRCLRLSACRAICYDGRAHHCLLGKRLWRPRGGNAPAISAPLSQACCDQKRKGLVVCGQSGRSWWGSSRSG